MAHQAWPGTTTGHSKHSSESLSEHQEEQAEESEEEQRATEDDEEHEDEGDGDDECQGGVLGHRGPRSCHRHLSTPIPVIDRIAILLLRGNLLNATSALGRCCRSFSVETDCRAGGGGGGGLGGKEGGGPSVLRLVNESIAAGLLTLRKS